MFTTFLFGLLLPTVTRTQTTAPATRPVKTAESEMEREIREEAARKESEFFAWVNQQVNGR